MREGSNLFSVMCFVSKPRSFRRLCAFSTWAWKEGLLCSVMVSILLKLGLVRVTSLLLSRKFSNLSQYSSYWNVVEPQLNLSMYSSVILLLRLRKTKLAHKLATLNQFIDDDGMLITQYVTSTNIVPIIDHLFIYLSLDHLLH